MSLILCIETGTDVCSVALSKDGKLLALRESSGNNDHARNVALYTKELLEENEIEPDELDALAIGMGPGSYTGLRIGVSFAKGMCYALKKPLIAVDSLESLARVVVEEYDAGILNIDDWSDALLCPMIDARRMEVYAEVFDTSLNSLTDVTAEIIAEDSFSDFISSGKEFIIFGNGASKCVDTLNATNVRLIEAVPSARGLCHTAQEKLNTGKTEDIAYFEPFYLKDFIVTASKKKIF